MTEPQRRAHTPDPEDISVREVTDSDDADGLFRVRMPVTSTAEARDGVAFDREKVEGFAAQVREQTVPVFLDHGRNETTGHRYSALGKVGYLDSPDVREREGVTDLMADFVLVDPDEADGTGTLRAALETVRMQARVGIPLASSIGWSEDTGERDLPGDADLLEASIVGIPSDARTTTDQTSAEPALARAVSAAAEDFDVATFVRELERQVEAVDTVHEPEYESAANPDNVAWDGLALEDFDGDVTPQDAVVYDKFLFSETGFPPADDADFGTLGFEVVDTDGTLLLQALEDALAALPAGDLTDEEREAMQEIIVSLAAAEFPDADLGENSTDAAATRGEYEVNGETITITPPDQVVNAAEAAQEAESDNLVPDECGTGVGDERAAQIIAGEVGPEVIDEIAAYLTSHAEDVTANGPPTDWSEQEWSDCGNAQYAKWGGTNDGDGIAWAQRKANAAAEAKGEELPYPERQATQTHNLDDPEFSEGDAVEWTSNDATVRGRVADVGDEFTVGGGDVTITGDEGEAVYLIHELDDSLEPPQYRRANVAKPESSLNESAADLPPLEGNFADEDNDMSDSDTESGGEPDDTDRDEQPDLRGMEEDMAEMREQMEENTRLCREMHEEMMGGDGGDDEDGEESATPDGEQSADADDADNRATVTLGGEEMAVDEASERIADLRDGAADADPADPQTQDRVADDEAADADERDTDGESIDWRA